MNGWIAGVLTAALAAAAAGQGLFPALAPGFFPFVMLCLVAVSAAGAGRRMIAPLAGGFSEEEKTVAGATLGLGVLSLSTFALAAAGLLRPWGASALLGAVWIYAWPEVRPTGESLRVVAARAWERPWPCVLIAGPLLFALWACLVPPHQYDSLVYHLALPQEYLRTGRLTAPEGIVYAHFPQNGEMLFSLALALGSDLLAQMMVWLSAALTIGWLVTFGRRVTSAAVWAAVLVATHTAVLLLSSTTYVEPLVMLWTTAAVLCFLASDEGDARGPLLLSAVFAGLALGTKYYAGLLAAALVVRMGWRGRFKSAVLFSAVVLGLFAPWLVKNWIYVGNPVFPFLYKVFPATKIGWTSDLATGYFQVLTEYGHARGFLRDLLALPVLLFRDPLRFGGGMDVLGDLGWDLTLWLWPFGLWAAWKGGRARGLAALTVLYVAGWFATGVVLRFLTALAPALALVGAEGGRLWWKEAAPRVRALAAAAAAALIAAHLFLLLFVHGALGSFGVLLALEDRQTFLSRLEYYPCAAYADAALAPTDKVLIPGEQRSYYLTVPHLASTVHAPNLYVRLANQADSPAALAASLRAEGFTHLLIVPREARRLGDSVGAFTPRGDANWKGLDSSLTGVYKGPGCVLASLRAP